MELSGQIYVLAVLTQGEVPSTTIEWGGGGGGLFAPLCFFSAGGLVWRCGGLALDGGVPSLRRRSGGGGGGRFASQPCVFCILSKEIS